MLFVVDTETTGLKPADACVWEIGVVAVYQGKIVDEFSTRVRPLSAFFSGRHQAVIKKVCGNPPDSFLLSLFDAPAPVDAADHLKDFICGCAWEKELDVTSDCFLTSFYRDFDMGFLGESPYGLRPPEYGYAPCVALTAQERMGDALPLHHTGERKRPSLREACAFFGVVNEQAHSALYDARAAAEIAIKMGLG